MLLSCIAFVFVLFPACLTADLCEPTEYFDESLGRCQKCRDCPEDSFVVPCAKSSDTKCYSMHEIKVSIINFRRNKWRETEEKPRIVHFEDDAALAQRVEADKLWSKIMFGLLIATFACAALSIVIFTHKLCKKFAARRRPQQTRFFNTTEFMNNLASLDRSMALDDILAKKKMAMVGKPVVLADEEFIDISGLPPRYSRLPEEEEQKCLLKIDIDRS